MLLDIFLLFFDQTQTTQCAPFVAWLVTLFATDFLQIILKLPYLYNNHLFVASDTANKSSNLLAI